MEKMMYLVWKHESESEVGFRRKLLEELSPKIIGLGARSLRITVVDEDVAPATPLRSNCTKPPMAGVISIWVDTAIRRQPPPSAGSSVPASPYPRVSVVRRCRSP